METPKIIATSQQVAQHKAGAIVQVSFAGHYPPGSDGNDCADEMVAYFRSVLRTTKAAAVLFDFRGLRYRWGDAIGGLALTLLRHAAGPFPSAIVATGTTARSLEALLDPHWMFGVVGTRMFSTIPEAVEYLQGMLEQHLETNRA